MDVTWLGVKLVWILASIASCLTIGVCWHMFKVYSYWKERGVAYAKPLPGIGNLSFIMRKSTWEFFDGLCRRHPADYVGIFLGWQPALVVQTPELARQVLVKDTDCFQDRYMNVTSDSDPIGSLNIFTVKNPIWSQMRHELSPMFTSARLRLVTELMNLNAQELVKKIQRDHIENNHPVNLKDLFSMYTSDTVGYTVFGLRVSSLTGGDSPLWVITNHMIKWTFRRGLEFTLFFYMPVIAKLLRLEFFSPAATAHIKQLFWNVVKERKISQTTSDKDLVKHLLKLKENLKLPADADSELADNLMMAQAAVFILGSIETSSTTLSYCLHELAHHPEEQEYLYQEVNEAVSTKGKNVLEYNDLIELKFLSSCLYETLRKHPPVAYLDRTCAKPCTLDKVKIEKGVPVFVNVVGIHNNPKYWPEPQLWDPHRPTATSDNDNVGFTFLPFGDGPRFCIGKRYGMMQLRAALAQIILKYRIQAGSVPYEIYPDPYSVFLAPMGGGSVKFVLRQ